LASLRLALTLSATSPPAPQQRGELVRNKGKLSPAVHPVPVEVEQFVARHKLASMGISIDELTAQQKAYMSGWEQGT
jgi:S-adenosylhomocysteine hydrolase